MPAYLSAIVFEETTSAYLEKFEADYGNDENETASVHTVGDLSGMMIELQKVDDGHYLLIVELDMTKSATAILTLMKAGYTSENDAKNLVLRKSVDLQPLIDSQCADWPEFNELSELPEMSDDGEDPAPEDTDLSDAIMKMVDENRAEHLEGLLSPCLTGNTAFNVKLLDVLDYLAYPLIRNGTTIDREFVKSDRQPARQQKPLLN